jgi:hypothetical protein
MNWLKNRKLIILLYGCVISLAALITLFGIRVYAPKLLDIDIKWLIAAAIPIILALIAGKFITRFKWLGVDIEIAAGDRIVDRDEVYQVIQPFAAQRKDDLRILRAMRAEDKARINALTFELGKAEYYEEGAIIEYVRELRYVHFFLIHDKAGRFVAMIDIYRALFASQDFELVLRFIRELEKGNIPQGFGVIITKHLPAQTKIVDAYQRLRKENPGAAFIVFNDDNSEWPIGYITREMAERYLADLVVKLIKTQGANSVE